ncbi:MAG: hypothetical protein PSV35_06370, partial [bacterium]|nr:hypothetical protein [bacterium]
PKQIEQLEKKINELHVQMTEPDFYQQSAQIIAEIGQQLAKEEQLLKDYYARWESLEERQ